MPNGSKSVVADTNANVLDGLWDVPGAGPVPTAVPGFAQNMATDLASWAAVPGQVMAPQQPQVPGQWSDVDEATRQANIAQQYQWGPETAWAMMGFGGAPADASLAMGRPSIEYLNARRAAKRASGGTKQATEAKYAPQEVLTPEEITEQKVESQWADQRIAQEAYWDNLFEQFGLTRGYSLDETFGSGSRKLAPFVGGDLIFSERGGSVYKQQKPGRWPKYLAQNAAGETEHFKDPEKAKQWAAPPEVMRPDPAPSYELPPWEEGTVAFHGSQKAGFEKFKLPDPAEEFMIDRAIGVHVAKDPKVSETFVNVRGSGWGGDVDRSVGGIYPLHIPDDSNFLEVNQAHLPWVESGVPSRQALVPKTPGNVETDQTVIGNLVYKTAFTKDPDMFARFIKSRHSGLSDTEAKQAAHDILNYKAWDNGYRKVYGIDDYFKSTGGINLFGDAFKEDRRSAVKLFHDEMRDQGWVGLKYINTSPKETEFATDPTSYVIFNPQTIRNKLTGKTMIIPAAIGAGAAAAGSPDKAEAGLYPKLGYGDEPPKQTGPREPVLPVLPDEPMPKPRKPTGEGIHSDILEKGQIAPGNIDLHNRPVVKNPDGSISTVRSITITDDQGRAVLIPTVVGNKVVSDKEAIKEYQRTGQHLGIFSSEKAADAYAKTLHEQQAKEYVK